MPLEAVLILVQSGWSVERVVSVCVERVNDLDNASNASGPTPTREPRYKEFREMLEILRELQVADAIELGAATVHAGCEEGKAMPGHDLVLRIRPKAEPWLRALPGSRNCWELKARAMSCDSQKIF